MDWDPQADDTDGYICPPCPVFYPTAEEFQQPLKYISSIRHIGMQAGICKIVPPKGWRPPFAINEKTFRFRTRVQQLNCIEGHSRAEGQFVEALRLFLYQRGEPMKELPRADGQLVNLHLLYKTVVSLGGFDAVCASGKWEQVVRRVGRTKAASEPSKELCQTYKGHYEATLLAYEKEQQGKDRIDNSSDTGETKVKLEEVHATPSGTSASGDSKATPSSKPRSISGRKRSASSLANRDQEEADEDGIRVKRTLFSEGELTSSEENDNHPTTPPKAGKRQQDQKRKIRQRDLEPEALKPSETRNERLGAPDIHAGQKFYRFFPDAGAVLAEVKRVFGGKKPHVAVRYLEDGSNDDIEMSTMEILIANGWDANAAELAYNSEICQVCLRGDCWDKMLLCDGCNSGQHLFCLDKPLKEVPTGDWYCAECVEDAMDPEKRKANPKFGFDMGAEISMMDYKERADAWKRNYFSLSSDTNPDGAISDRDLETEYWRLLSIPVHEQRLEVQYGSDVDTGANGSAFPRLDLRLKNLRTMTKRWKNLTTQAKSEYVLQLSKFFSHGLREGLSAKAGGENYSTDAAKSLEELWQRYAQDDWNLNNMPKLPGSVLQHLDEDIKGVMVPWLYAGMCFSTFCWHVEDHNMYSTSYLHCGAPKTWYGIPCASADHFERTMKELTPELFGSQPDLHMQLVTMFSPKTLREHGVPVYRATHRPNEFIVTFPSAYHAGFNNGFNCAEAVNFATVDWLPWGAKSLRKYREFRKLPVFCHEALVCTLAETLVDGSSFDVEHTESSLLPALEQLLQDYCEFQRHVDETVSGMHVAKREPMADFEKHQYRPGVASTIDSEPSSSARPTRRSMVARACNKPAKMGGTRDNRGPKMKMKMETADASMRPTRMVLWAGRSGKNEGLRCVTCKQYCYLQAVVCTKCRPPHGSSGGPTVGCLQHYPTMCKCRDPENFVYLYRYEASRLEEVISSIRGRIEGVRAWNRDCDAAIRSCKRAISTKPTIYEIKRLLSRGKSCGGADRDRLDTLELAISDAESWDMYAERLLQSLEHESIKGEHLCVNDLDLMLKKADKLLVEPAAVGKLREAVMDWRAVHTAATEMLNSLRNIQLSVSTRMGRSPNAMTDTSSVVHSMGYPSVLLQDNVRFGQLTTAIDNMIARLRGKKESEAEGSLLRYLLNGKIYLEVLCQVNVLAATILQRSGGSAVMSAPSQVQVERVLEQVDRLHLHESVSIANAESLRKLLGTTATAAQEMDIALGDRSKSTEELEVLLQRAQTLPIPPMQVHELENRLQKCRQWDQRAQQILNGVNTPSHSNSIVSRPSVEEVEALYAQADAHFVPSASLLRRQLHSRLQDCRRWYDTVHALFLRPSNSHLPLTQFLQTALDNVQHQHSQSTDQAFQIHSRLHCVCQQVLSERAQLMTCQRCQSYFHPQCIPELLPERAKEPFYCMSCRPPQRKRAVQGARHDGSPQIFCVCRGFEQAPMICCDFCDEWYHSGCVDLSPRDLDGIEAFRCPRCSRRQNLYYLDKKLLRRECVGRRPTLARVESFLTQLQTQLVAFPPGAHELMAYVHAVKGVENDVATFVRDFARREFSPAAYATQDYVKTHEAAVVKLMERVTSLEVGLETAQTQLGAVHWCLRACQLVLGPNNHAPRYSHLAALLQDVKNQEPPAYVFPREEYRLMQLTIAERVHKASLWLRATKTLEVEEWNVEKARRLQLEAAELSAYLELPAAELQLVQRIIAGHDIGVMDSVSVEEEEEEEEEEEVGYEDETENPSALAWKKQRHW